MGPAEALVLQINDARHGRRLRNDHHRRVRLRRQSYFVRVTKNFSSARHVHIR